MRRVLFTGLVGLVVLFVLCGTVHAEEAPSEDAAATEGDAQATKEAEAVKEAEAPAKEAEVVEGMAVDWDNLSKYRAKELRQILEERGVECKDCTEKEHLMDAVRQAQDKPVVAENLRVKSKAKMAPGGRKGPPAKKDRKAKEAKAPGMKIPTFRSNKPFTGFGGEEDTPDFSKMSEADMMEWFQKRQQREEEQKETLNDMLKNFKGKGANGKPKPNKKGKKAKKAAEPEPEAPPAEEKPTEAPEPAADADDKKDEL